MLQKERVKTLRLFEFLDKKRMQKENPEALILETREKMMVNREKLKRQSYHVGIAMHIFTQMAEKNRTDFVSRSEQKALSPLMEDVGERRASSE